jgi:hypothetical protein
VKKTIIAALAASAIVAALAVPTLGSAGGKLTASISMGSNASIVATSSSDQTFFVTRSYAYDKETFWVTNKCFDETGTMVERMDLPVIWGTSASLSGYAGPFPTGGSSCTAYVTLRPWQDRVFSNATIDY